MGAQKGRDGGRRTVAPTPRLAALALLASALAAALLATATPATPTDEEPAPTPAAATDAAATDASPTPAAAIPAAAPAPFTVRSASLVQHGRSLRWKVTIDHPISSSGLVREHRALCLILHAGRPSRELALCLAPGASSGAEARLRLGEPTSARGRTIRARIKRRSADSLIASFRPSALGIGYEDLHWQVLSAVDRHGCTSALGASPTPAGASPTPAGASPTPAGASPTPAGASPTPAGASPTPASGCSVAYPAQSRLTKLHTPKLVGCVASGSSLVFNGPTNRHEIALTFDDGPWNDPPSTAFVNLLARHHVPATFFEIGEQISTYDPTGAIERKMLANGDMIGDHTWTHPDMVTLSLAQQRSQLEQTSNAIKRATGFTPCLWRPPYGDISEQLDGFARSLGFLTIYWNIDPRDWSLPGVSAIEANVLANARNGGIVEMHFGGGPRQQTLAALPHIIDTLRARGYRFVNLAQMLGLKLIYR
ncbi:MAG: polysaccharide deacetylase family protein [Solirubrobacteraceae bacterium]